MGSEEQPLSTALLSIASIASTAALWIALNTKFLNCTDNVIFSDENRLELQSLKEQLGHFKKQRQAERQGRIRAEMELRALSKERHYKDVQRTVRENDNKDGIYDTMLLSRIGTILSPFTKRMGTPRQGQLVPHGIGFLQLDNPKVCPMETVIGLSEYSHCWLVFQFHANTSSGTKKRTKIKPPRGGGIKVGCLSTRSPHRPNDLGLSLVKVERVDEKNKRVVISGLDLVNGTPVYDIKPFVPWDCPNYFDQQQSNCHPTALAPSLGFRVPSWVSADDALRSVSFLPRISNEMRRLVVLEKRLYPLYDPLQNKTDDIQSEALENAKKAICEVLAQDPRASNNGKRGSSMVKSISTSSDGANKPETENTPAFSRAKGQDPYKVMFGTLQIEFLVDDANHVSVVHVSHIDLEKECTFVDGIPLAVDGAMK